jgi:hypothetical protein
MGLDPLPQLGGGASEALDGACEGRSCVRILGGYEDGVIPGNSAEGAGQTGAVKLNGERVSVTAGRLEDNECSSACDGNEVLTKRSPEGSLATFGGQGGG